MKEQFEQEFADFVGEVSGRLLHAADLLTGSRARAEDLVQYGLATAYARWPSIRNGSPEGYVRITMLNRYRDWWRRLRWRELPLPDSVDHADALTRATPGAKQFEDHATDIARRDVIQRALRQLSRQERAVVVLRYWLDLSEAQIATELGIAPGTVKSTAARALTKLRTSPDIALAEGVLP